MRYVTTFLIASLLLLSLPHLGWAQGMSEALAGQNLRGYVHMFIAYAIAWLVVLFWIISIFRRLGRVEKELNR